MSCDQFLAAIPTPGIFVAALIGFTLGGLVGYLFRSHTHPTAPSRATEENMDKPNRQDWRRLYERFAPFVVVFCLVSVIVANFGVLWQTRVNRAQDNARTADNTALIDCFDTFATDLAGNLPPVRAATQARDQALTDALGDLGLKGALVKIAARDFDDADFKALIKSLARYEAADKNLREVRKQNPYPPAPSKFCELPE